MPNSRIFRALLWAVIAFLFSLGSTSIAQDFSVEGNTLSWGEDRKIHFDWITSVEMVIGNRTYIVKYTPYQSVGVHYVVDENKRTLFGQRKLKSVGLVGRPSQFQELLDLEREYSLAIERSERFKIRGKITKKMNTLMHEINDLIFDDLRTMPSWRVHLEATGTKLWAGATVVLILGVSLVAGVEAYQAMNHIVDYVTGVIEVFTKWKFSTGVISFLSFVGARRLYLGQGVRSARADMYWNESYRRMRLPWMRFIAMQRGAGRCEMQLLTK